ncbi:MAG TPA: lysylphosphatidylglycerol synthase transmembrane domain-containing protein [Candidatus Acidoferrales bacterium]|jgi:uncharacterized membrane protein YbhN (UPF0104 family)|nr:lysylphosphatidylglycerol synthase transmembrane domain-containing protein [Candidatus Acidoferrales bacterium]
MPSQIRVEASSDAPDAGLESKDHGRRPGRRWVRQALAYGLAAVIIGYLARGTSWRQFEAVLHHVNAWEFLAATAASFACWFLGDTLAYARVFSYFHGEVSFREMLPASAAQYFLQAVNSAVGGAALAFLMSARKRVSLLSSGATLAFLGLVDLLVMAWSGLAVALLVPHSWLAGERVYAALVTASVTLIAWFWMRGRPRQRVSRWLYDRPWLVSFRNARPAIYVKLGLLRAAVFALQGAILYFQLASFGVHVPFRQVMSFEPAGLFLNALPLTPSGLGVLQAVLVLGFHEYGTRAALLSVGLMISIAGVLMRLPLGLCAARSLAHDGTN